MRNYRKTIAALTAAIMTAASVPGLSGFAGGNAGSDSVFVSTSEAAVNDNDASVISDAELAEKLAQLIKQGDQLKYGEALYKTGTPDGERWAEEFYWQRIEFYGEEFLEKYIVNGEFLREIAEADRAAILEKNRSYESETTDAINEYLRSNSIAGYAYIRKTDGAEKIYITYDGQLDKIRAYISENGIDESSVVYEQGHDDIVNTTQPVTTYHTHSLGDVNGDGSITIADAILFQRWLLSVPDTELPDWKAADMNSDNRLDVFDFCLMKRELISKMPVVSYPEKGTIDLTLDDVIILSHKGDELTWSDFKDYKSKDIGSGLYIEKYDLEDDYTLLVGGVPDRKPDYIFLYHHGKDKEAIDIRTEDVQKYLDNEMIADIASMSVKEIDSAELKHYPSGKTIKLREEQTEWLTALLDFVTLTERSDMYMAWSGPSVSFTVSGNGRSRSFEIVDSYIVINERGYTVDSKRTDQLKELADSVSAENPSINEFVQPLGFSTLQEAENQIYNYDVSSSVLKQYPERFRYDYRKMFSRIKSDNYLPVVSIDDDSAEVDTAPNPFVLILFPEAQYEDIGIGSYVKFNNNIYYVTYSYADEDVLAESSGIADYLQKRIGRNTDKTVTVNGKEASLFNNSDVQTYISAFVDDMHYCTIVGPSEMNVLQLFEVLSFEKRSFEKKLMTKNDVIELSKKGSELRVSDFESFRCAADWTESGKLCFEVEGTTFVVIVDAAAPRSAPEYVSLFSSVSSYWEYVDIRNEDMESFFADPPFKVY